MLERSRSRAAALIEEPAQEPPALTKAQIRELDRRIRDSEDRTRYILASVLTERHALYYNVAEDTFGWKDPGFATLFKRREAAQAIQKLLKGQVQVAACRVTRRGRLVLSSVPPLRPIRGHRRRHGKSLPSLNG
jgi:hypothetical protein